VLIGSSHGGARKHGATTAARSGGRIILKSLFVGVAAACLSALHAGCAFAEAAQPKTVPLVQRVTIATQL